MGEHRKAIAATFGIADENLELAKVEVFDAQTEDFFDAQARAVEKLGEEFLGAVEVADEGADFSEGEDDGKALGAFGTDGFDGVGEGLVEDVAVEKQKGAEGLILGGGSDVAFDGEVGEEGFDFGFAHVLGVPFVVKEDKTADPIDVACFGAVGVMLDAQGVAYAIEELFGFGRVCHEVAK